MLKNDRFFAIFINNERRFLCAVNGFCDEGRRIQALLKITT